MLLLGCLCCSEMMSAPVRRMDEILALPHSADNFKDQPIPPSDDDSWLYNGEDELNSALQERQREMELYDLKHKKKQKSEVEQDPGPSSGSNLDDFDLGNISKTMQEFVHEMSTYEGAEVPESRQFYFLMFLVTGLGCSRFSYICLV